MMTCQLILEEMIYCRLKDLEKVPDIECIFVVFCLNWSFLYAFVLGIVSAQLDTHAAMRSSYLSALLCQSDKFTSMRGKEGRDSWKQIVMGNRTGPLTCLIICFPRHWAASGLGEKELLNWVTIISHLWAPLQCYFKCFVTVQHHW